MLEDVGNDKISKIIEDGLDIKWIGSTEGIAEKDKHLLVLSTRGLGPDPLSTVKRFVAMIKDKMELMDLTPIGYDIVDDYDMKQITIYTKGEEDDD